MTKKNELTMEPMITTDKTPIEVALQIDENGMTTASKLYEFLNLNPSNFTKWCKRNIENNNFATEDIDYIRLVLEYESAVKGKTRIDYKLSSDFAKKLSMTGNTERHEEARKYFVACEQGLKVAAQRLQANNQINLQPLVDAITVLTNTITTFQNDVSERLDKIEQAQANRYLINKHSPSTWFRKMNPKYKMLEEYFGCTRKELYSNIYKEIEDTYDVDLNEIYEDYCYENHLPINEGYIMDAIEHNSRLKAAVTVLVDDALVKFGLQTEEQVQNFKRETIFDRAAVIPKNFSLLHSNSHVAISRMQ